MKRSTDRILTTHVGSLIRPPELQEFLRAKQAGQPYDEEAYERTLKTTVARDRQAAGRVRHRRRQRRRIRQVVSPGRSMCWSASAASSAGRSGRRQHRSRAAPTAAAFSEFYAELDAQEQRRRPRWIRSWSAPINYTGQKLLQKDIDNFKAALAKVKVTEGFLPVAAPASVIPDRKNEYYKNDDDVLAAIGEAMRDEYKQIIDNGLLVQLDDARTAVTFDRMVPPAIVAGLSASGWRATSKSSTRRSRACRARRSAITSAGEAGRARTPPTFRSRPSST